VGIEAAVTRRAPAGVADPGSSSVECIAAVRADLAVGSSADRKDRSRASARMAIGEAAAKTRSDAVAAIGARGPVVSVVDGRRGTGAATFPPPRRSVWPWLRTCLMLRPRTWSVTWMSCRTWIG